MLAVEHWFKRNTTVASFVSAVLVITSLLLLMISLGSSSSSSSNDFHHIASRSSNDIIKKIRILLISDIHANTSNVAKVHQYIQTSNTPIDHLWVSGDFLNLQAEAQEDGIALQQAETEMIDLLSEIKTIHPHPVIVPGNHDPNTLFATDSDKYFNFAECINIHNQIYPVKGETNLFMAGFGGSVPAFCESKAIWAGNPFVDDAAFGDQYAALMQRIMDNKGNAIKTANSIVLFTHNGPSMCSTTMDWSLRDANKVITSGSAHVMSSLLNEALSDKIFLNIHGHTHLGFGQGHIGNVRVINPGSLKGGGAGTNFAFLDLVQMKDETWAVDTVEFKNLATIHEM